MVFPPLATGNKNYIHSLLANKKDLYVNSFFGLKKLISKLLKLRTYLLSTVFIGYMWSESRSIKIFHFSFYLCFDLQPPGTNMKLVTEVPLQKRMQNHAWRLFFFTAEACNCIHISTKFYWKGWCDFIYFTDLYLRISMILYEKQKL